MTSNLLKAFKTAYPKRARNRIKKAFESYIKERRGDTISELEKNSLLLPYLQEWLETNYLDAFCNNMNFEIHCGDTNAIYNLLIEEWR